ncbi:biopolymer transporter ExbB [Ruixingdingia sedimenti]|uniref:Biopolymer transporter ExbB n=1 Tax=Ruixingdingia sedimenti TaxID=3073604 RepID=A0ABU1FDJ0_9RHOB|nr:biopolymer transporter ExbB [Xinfangfangia sp. LG-4]MDR5654922.1 biopolymer transporter ExbB [Xinfangfangia sp. LG-4]
MFTQPVRQIVAMLTVIVLVAVGVWLVLPTIRGIFFSNPWLNSFIGVVFLIGLLSCFWQVFQLIVSVIWIEGFVTPGAEPGDPPRLLAPLAALMGSRATRLQITTASARSILDSVATRMDEARDVTRYLANLLIFLGLLGTFYGLAITVPAVVETIRGLAPQAGETGLDVFNKLMGGLESQLGGMGTAFSSSLMGLAGSLVVGLLDLFAGHGQNRFYRELEEWISTITRLGFAAGEGEGPGGDQAALIGVLEQMAQQIETMGQRMADDRAQLSDGFEALAQGMLRLVEQGESATARAAGQASTLAEGQERLIAALSAMPEAAAQIDAESRMRLRSIDVQLLRILEEIAAGRQESVADLRGDLGALTAAIRQLSRGALGRG